MSRVCRHCQNPEHPVNRPRGLCWGCYYTPGVKELVGPAEPNSKYGRRGPSAGNFTGKMPAHPTTAPPGTPEKVAVMAHRAMNGEQLHHPNDSQW